MKKERILKNKYNFPGGVEPYLGESIENKVKRITENNEPISDGAPLIYTDKKDGVLPQYDIRTDKWDVAQNAMDAVNRAKIAKGQNLEIPKEGDDKTQTAADDKPETTDTGGE